MISSFVPCISLSIIHFQTSSAVPPFFIPALARSTPSVINWFFTVLSFAGLSIHESSNFAATFSSPFLPAFRAAQSQGMAAPIAHPTPVSSRDGSLLSAIIEYKVISQAPSIHQANILPKVHLASFKRFQAFQIIQGAPFIAHFTSHPHIAVCAISPQALPT